MHAKSTSLDDYATKNEATNCLWLLKEIKGIMFHFKGQRYLLISLADACTAFYNYKQGTDEPLIDYLHQFRANVEVLEHNGGTISLDPGLIKLVKALGDRTTKTPELHKQVRDCTLPLTLLKGADQHHFGSLWTDLENQFTGGTDQYPVDLTAAYNMLINFRILH